MTLPARDRSKPFEIGNQEYDVEDLLEDIKELYDRDDKGYYYLYKKNDFPLSHLYATNGFCTMNPDITGWACAELIELGRGVDTDGGPVHFLAMQLLGENLSTQASRNEHAGGATTPRGTLSGRTERSSVATRSSTGEAACFTVSGSGTCQKAQRSIARMRARARDVGQVWRRRFTRIRT